MIASVTEHPPRRSIEASVVVLCPRSSAIGWAQRYFDDRQRVVSLAVPLRAFGVPTFLRVLRNVTVSLESIAVRTAFTPRYEHALHLRWKPTHGGPFPEIDGVMTARAHATHAVLRFSGTYAPPLGPAGRVFDALVGRRIARVAIQTLLHDIKRSIERLNIEEHASASFAAFEANVRDSRGGGHYGVPLHGNVVIRRDGSYVAAAIMLEGEAPEYAALEPCDRALSPDRVARFLGELLEADASAPPKLTPT